MVDKMNIVLSGIYYPVAILRYFEAAFKRRDDVKVVTIGPYTGSWIPWNGGMMLKPEYAKVPDIPLDLASPNPFPIRLAEALLPKDFVPDVWVQVDAGFYFQGCPSKGRNFFVATDPHALNYDRQRSLADKFFCMQTPYSGPDDVWLPYAYDPVWHKTSLAPVTREYDVGYVGAPYPDRVRLMQALQQQGYKVLSTGYGPAYGEYRDLQSKCRIGVNWSTRKDLCARVFEIMHIGVCPLVNRVPDLERVGFVDGRDYLGFDSLEEALEQVKRALTIRVPVPNDQGGDIPLAEQIDFNARIAVEPHTWDARVEAICRSV